MDQFENELEFEQAVIDALQRHGWAKEVLHHPTEEDLIDNWAKILYDNNQEVDRLNKFPLVPEEMDELLEQIRNLRTPHALNGFINGYSVSITRRNPDDKDHFGKEVSLRIYDRMQIAAGSSVYQIAEQPVFQRRKKILQDRRGDLLLLWKKELSDPDTDPQERERTLEELHRSFAYLSQEEQKFANLFLHDVQTGDVKLVSGMTFSDYIVQYAKKAKNDQIDRMAEELGLDRLRLTRIMETNVNEKNLNEYGRFDQLKATVVRERAQEYFSRVDGEKVPPFLVNNRVDKLLTDFITSGGFDL